MWWIHFCFVSLETILICFPFWIITSRMYYMPFSFQWQNRTQIIFLPKQIFILVRHMEVFPIEDNLYISFFFFPLPSSLSVILELSIWQNHSFDKILIILYIFSSLVDRLAPVDFCLNTGFIYYLSLRTCFCEYIHWRSFSIICMFHR